jgi:hypothetical protein
MPVGSTKSDQIRQLREDRFEAAERLEAEREAAKKRAAEPAASKKAPKSKG